MEFQRSFLGRALFILWALNFCIAASSGETCGGILEGDSGAFESSTRSTFELQQPCFWIIKTQRSSRVLFEVDNLDSESAFHLYPDHDPTETFLQPIVLTASNLSSIVETQGQTLIVILVESTNRNEPFSFSWSSDVDGGDGEVFNSASYIDNFQGSFTRKQLDYPQKTVLAVNAGSRSESKLSVQGEVKFSTCDLIDPCQCSYFGLYEVLPSGYLREVNRVCGRSRTFSEVDLSSSLIQFVYITRGPEQVQVSESNSVNIRWSVEGGEEPSPPTTKATTTTTESGIITTEDPSDTEPTTKTTTTTTSKPQPLRCPAPEDIAPCTCSFINNPNNPSITCRDREVTQSSIDRLFPALASANQNNDNEDSLIHIHLLTISYTNLPKLDLTSLVNANVSLGVLRIEYNSYLTKIVGPNLNETGAEIAAKVNYIALRSHQLNNEGFGDFFRYFDPTALRILDLQENNITGGQFPIADGSGDIEYLPGLGALINMEELSLEYKNKEIRYIGGGQFKRNRNLKQIVFKISSGVNCVFDNDAFHMDPPDVEFAWNETFVIDIARTFSADDRFNGTSSTFLTGRPTEVNLSYNDLRSVSRVLFEDFLLAHARNKLDFSSNQIQCNEKVSWLKEQREAFEPRVFGLNCANDPGETVFTSDLV